MEGGLVDVHSAADDAAIYVLSAKGVLDEDSAYLAIIYINIVWPLHCDVKCGRTIADGLVVQK